jgi:hypothetical protein
MKPTLAGLSVRNPAFRAFVVTPTLGFAPQPGYHGKGFPGISGMVAHSLETGIDKLCKGFPMPAHSTPNTKPDADLKRLFTD